MKPKKDTLEREASLFADRFFNQLRPRGMVEDRLALAFKVEAFARRHAARKLREVARMMCHCRKADGKLLAGRHAEWCDRFKILALSNGAKRKGKR